jgi:gamma-glutamyltranspeptidase/glutathione hydrolase
MLFTFPDPRIAADSLRRSWRKCAVLSLVLLCAACSGDNQPGVVRPVEGFFGGVAADEPRAAIAGRDVLVAGGSAADAAVAIGFTLAVTLPSSAGLGGGGACVAFDGPSVTPALFDFPAASAGQGRIAVPALARGMALLHARHGRMLWAQLLGPAEAAARFGAPVSRALAHDLAEAPADLARDPASARIFAPNGRPIGEGESLVQLDLAGVLGQIRQKGAGEAYVGPLGRTIVGVSDGALSAETLRGYLPQAGTPAIIRINSQQQFVIVGDSAPTTALFSRLLALGVDVDPGAADRPRFWAEAGAAAEGRLAEALSRGQVPLVPPAGELQALAARVKAGSHERPARSLGPVGTARAGATAFVAVDKNGLAVACALGMNAPWGTGRVLPGTGILAAPPPSVEAPRSVGVIAVAPGSGALYLAASASGRAAPFALAQTAWAVISDRQNIDAAIEQPRVAYDGAADLSRIEPGVPQESLARGGFRFAEASPLGIVGAFSCPGELIRGRGGLCEPATDPRGAGLAFGGTGIRTRSSNFSGTTRHNTP